MINKSEFYIDSNNKKNKLHIMMWQPDGPIQGILQISHGMIEYIERYDDFARYLAQKGFLVVGNDHLGHGKSVLNEEEFGYFSATDPSKTVVQDLYKVTHLIKSKYPNIPYFLLGHSMGSFMARRYLMTYGNELDGAIIMGTGEQPYIALGTGQLLIRLIKLFKPDNYRSLLLEKACFGSYNRHFKPQRTKCDWLSQDTEVVDAYMKDPFCGFIFTLNGYQTLFSTLGFIKRSSHIKQIPPTLPIMMVAGKEDPVGNYGKSVTKVYNRYRKAGIQNISLKLYENDRHELINELDKAQIYQDIYTWVNTQLLELK